MPRREPRRACSRLAARGIRATSAIIVCKPYAARRALATAPARWPGVRWHCRPPVMPMPDYLAADPSPGRAISLMVGNVQRLRRYGENGYQDPVAVPGPVWAAAGRLAAAGFGEFVLTEPGPADGVTSAWFR